MITSSTWPGSMPARRTDSATTFAPSSGADSGESPPKNLPIGVRTALNMTDFSIVRSPAHTRQGRSKKRPCELPSVAIASIGAPRHVGQFHQSIESDLKSNSGKGHQQQAGVWICLDVYRRRDGTG